MGGESGLKGISERNGHIRIIIHHKKTRPKPFSITLKIKPTSANLKYAQRQREAWLHQLELGNIPPELQGETKTTSIKQLLNDWLDSKSSKIKASTLNDYQKSVKVLIAEFGDLDAAQITIGMIRDYCDTSKATGKRINNLISPLRQSLQRAVEDELIQSNVLSGWSYKKPRIKTQDEVDPFSQEEQKAILNKSLGQTKNLIRFALWTGLRTSELVALRWSDIDFIKQEVRISRARTQVANEDEVTKTIAGNRVVKLLSPALDALLNQKQFTFLADKEVFHNPLHDEPWKGDQPIRKAWTAILKKAGVRYRRPYQTRHTYASMMLSAGEHPMWVARQMGHTDWSMISKTYGKWMPEAMPDAGQKAVEIFGSFLERFEGENRGITGD